MVHVWKLYLQIWEFIVYPNLSVIKRKISIHNVPFEMLHKSLVENY